MDEYDGLVACVEGVVTGDRVRFTHSGASIGGGYFYHFDWLEPASTKDKTAFLAEKAQKEAEAAKREPTKTELLLARRVEILAERLRGSLIVIQSLHTAIGAIGDIFKSYSDKSQGIVDEATEAYEDLTESLAEDFPEFFGLEDSEDSEEQS